MQLKKIHTSCNEQKGKTARVYHQSWICTTNSLATERESPRDKGGDVSRGAAPHVRVGPARARGAGPPGAELGCAGVATSDASKTSAWPVATTPTGGPRRRRRRRLPPPSPTINTSLLLFPPPHKQTNHHLFFLGCS